MNTTFDVSWRYARADLGITFRASAALPIDAPNAVDKLSIVNLCLCFYFCTVQHGGDIYYVWLYLGSRDSKSYLTQGSIGYLTRLLQREKDALAIPTVVVERQCHSSVVAELLGSNGP